MKVSDTELNRVQYQPSQARSSAMNSAATLLHAAAAPSVSPGVETLRHQVGNAADTAGEYTLAQLRTIVAMVRTGASLADVSAASSVAESAVVKATVELGTWLTHVLGPADVPFVPTGSLEQPFLFPVTTPPRGKKAKAAPAPAKSRQRRVPVEINAGFCPSSLGKDITASLGAVLAAAPDAELLERFWSRTHRRVDKTLSYEVIAGVAFFARLGRLDDIGQVNAKSVPFQRLALAAHDLLEVGRRDALRALAVLVSDESDMSIVAPAVSAAAVLFEVDMAKLAKLAASPSESSARLFGRERKFLVQRVLANPAVYAPASIAALSEGQVLRIAQAAGVVTDRNRPLEGEARRVLVDMGLGNDADIHLPAAIDAVRDGRVEEFRAEMDRTLAYA
jgi:hypothetical protein